MVKVERRTGRLLVNIRSGNAKEFVALEDWADSKGVELELIETETPPQNGVAERLNRILLEITRALMIEANMPKLYWTFAVQIANHLRNVSVEVRDSNGKTPFELWHGHKPNLECLRTWRSKVLYYKKDNDKLESRAVEGTFVGYGKLNRQYYIVTTAGELKLVTSPVFFEKQRGHLSHQNLERLAHSEFDYVGAPIYDDNGFERPRTEMVLNERNAENTAFDDERIIRDITIQSDGIKTSSQNGTEKGAENRTRTTVENRGQKMDIEENKQQDIQNEGEFDESEMEHQKDDNGEDIGEKTLYAESEQQLQNDRKTKENDNECKMHEYIDEDSTEEMKQEDEESNNQEKLEKEAKDETTRKSARIKKPTSALIESKETEERFNSLEFDKRGLKRGADTSDIETRLVQRLRVRLASAMELLLQHTENEEEKASIAKEVDGVQITKSYQEAINNPTYGNKWREAIHTEIATLIKFGTWKIVRRRDVISQSFNIASTRWVFDVKIGTDGRVERFKARLVVRGFSQKEGEDFDDTFAPVFRLDSLRMLMSIAAQQGMKIHLIDGTNAFVGS